MTWHEMLRAASKTQFALIVHVETRIEGVRDTLKETNDKLDRLLGYPAPKRWPCRSMAAQEVDLPVRQLA